jgi:Arc/MetJ-type ribon-helix-helix transcriptional regulator
MLAGGRAMVRTQVQLREEQVQVLKDLAAERGASMAELIRQAVDLWIETEGAVTREERKRRALAAVGQFRSGLGDLSENHDKYLAEAYEA